MLNWDRWLGWTVGLGCAGIAILGVLLIAVIVFGLGAALFV
ncbi:hypothetical protein [Microbacterium caowuchunii]|nr:hypothetical protein [Microbacterium caowuchunii]